MMALTLSLTSCGGKKPPFDPAVTAQALVEAPGVFSETLEPLEEAVALALYGLEGQDGVEVTSYHSTGATAEEATVVRFADEAAAKAFVPRLQLYLADQLEANGGYRPLELPKLENARLEMRENSVLLLVAADYQAAEALLG